MVIPGLSEWFENTFETSVNHKTPPAVSPFTFVQRVFVEEKEER